jgi:hypothetical protein
MTGLLVMGLYLIPPSHAHTPLVSCYANADGTITCEGRFPDGSSRDGNSPASFEKENPMFEKILIGLIVVGAVYYLYRRFRTTSSADGASCGCGGCDSCGTARIACESNRSKEEKNEK